MDIRPDHLEIVQNILHEHLPGGVKVWVFGSRATWTTKDSSDLDLALESKSQLSHKTLGALKDSFENSMLPYAVDVVDLNRIGESFRKIVEMQRVPLPPKETATDRTALTVAADRWHDVTLGDLVEIRHGFAFKGNFIYDEPRGDLLLTPGNFAIGGGFKGDKFKYYDGPVVEEYVLQEGDLIVTMTDLSKQSDTLGYPVVVPACTNERRYLHNQRLGKVVPKEASELHTRFLYYILCSAKYRHEVLASATGTTVKHTSPDRIKQFKFSLPPPEEQRAIARILGTFDNKIELNGRMNETLEEVARALFKSWFVDFEPVRAKMEGRWRSGESLPGLPADLYDLFPDRLVSSELGEIPEGWEVRPLDSIATFLNGLALQKYPATDGSALPVIKIAQLRAGHSLGADLASPDLPEEYKVDDGDVLFSWSGSLELVIWAGGQGALNQHLFKVASQEYPQWLYYFWVREHLPEFREIAADKATTMGHIQRRHLTEALTVASDGATLEAMSRHVQPLLDRSLSLRIASRALAAQRDALLPKLISGEVRMEGE